MWWQPCMCTTTCAQASLLSYKVSWKFKITVAEATYILEYKEYIISILFSAKIPPYLLLLYAYNSKPLTYTSKLIKHFGMLNWLELKLQLKLGWLKLLANFVGTMYESVLKLASGMVQ